MKNILSLNGNGLKFWLFTLIALPLCANANNSDISLNSGVAEEFFADGKEWEVSHFYSNYYYLDGKEYKEYYKECRRIHVKVAGEETFEGKLCKRLEISQEHKGDCGQCKYWHIPSVMYAYEDEGKLYVYRVADYYDTYDDETLEEAYNATLKSFQELNDPDDPDFNYENFWYTVPARNAVKWMDGVGCSYGFGKLDLLYFPIAPNGDSAYYKLVKCSKNGVPLYDKTEELATILDTPTGAEVICAEGNEGTYYNLQGIKVSNPIKGELYIFNGKKIVY